ncbi:MAG: serine/threonine protein kinase [Acidimicrobiia bacterium]|nr:serine/threonine protein kinase [Acidimicrobiia bacterium]
MPDEPLWLIQPPATDTDLGILRSGKEAQVNLIERTADHGRRCLLARKRYLPRSVQAKGQLEALGVQRASAFRHDVAYREGRQFRKTRDRRAVEAMTSYGRKLLQDRWTGHEHAVMTVLWEAGVSVPYPVAYAEDCFDMEYVGDEAGAAPQLARSKLDAAGWSDAFAQTVEGLAAMTAAGWAHGDLSAFNLLWWNERVWFIDFPQAVDIAANPQGLGYLHRDVTNVCRFFERRGLAVDAEEVFAELLGRAF